ncbi:MAG: T9SS type A sorting domain-containing protein [Muribaculaceae bacterium]|nr:T9SS type A sorting domain-containing protein [Muribaculaceae bacterium]
MKKILTLLTMGLLTAASASAVVMPEFAGKGMSFSLTPEAQQMNREAFASLAADIEAGVVSPGTMQKIWQDRNGNVYDARFNMMSAPLCEQLVFTDDKGQPVQFTFDELPFYWVNYIMYQYDKTGARVGIYNQALSWPSMYVYDQIFTWDGPVTSDNMIPIEDRDFKAVPFDVMANPYIFPYGAEQTRTFTESMNVWPEFNQQNTAFQTFGLLPTEMLGIQSSYQNTLCFTSLSGAASNLTFNYYDKAEQVASITNNIYLNVGGINRAIRPEYEGGITVMGFEPANLSWNAGEIHVFNLGVTGSDELGELNYYPEEWGPLQAYRIYIPGEYMNIFPNVPNSPIKDENIGIGWKEGIDAQNESFENINYAFTTVYSAVDAEPTNSVWHLVLGQEAYDAEFDEWYYSIKPEAGTFVQNGWTFDWSQVDGCLMYYHQFPFTPNTKDSQIFIGSTEGAGLMINDGDNTTFTAITKQDVVYHYDPQNISNTKLIPAVGDIKVESGVKEVLAEGNFNVSARNGAINVVAGENGRVAIYSVNGQLVKSVDAKAGQTVSIEAAKGLYVVKAGKKAVKVVL